MVCRCGNREVPCRTPDPETRYVDHVTPGKIWNELESLLRVKIDRIELLESSGVPSHSMPELCSGRKKCGSLIVISFGFE